jgi:hypothetical protein
VTTCPHCDTRQTLAEATVEGKHEFETFYCCCACNAVILVVSTRPTLTREGRGYRLGDWLVRNPTDLYFLPPGRGGEVRFPASAHALD